MFEGTFGMFVPVMFSQACEDELCDAFSQQRLQPSCECLECFTERISGCFAEAVFFRLQKPMAHGGTKS